MPFEEYFHYIWTRFVYFSIDHHEKKKRIIEMSCWQDSSKWLRENTIELKSLRNTIHFVGQIEMWNVNSTLDIVHYIFISVIFEHTQIKILHNDNLKWSVRLILEYQQTFEFI